MGRMIAGKLMLVAGVIAVTLLGNLRLQASEVQARPGHGLTVPRMPRGDARPATVVASADPTVVDATFEPSASSDDGDALGPDDVRLVPAIYAWDPDVRFVFFRHVSKWM